MPVKKDFINVKDIVQMTEEYLKQYEQVHEKNIEDLYREDFDYE